MNIIKHPLLESDVLYIPAGRQVTFEAFGLSGADTVEFDLLELSKAPEATGDYCCVVPSSAVEVLSATPMRCADGRLTRLTAEFPVGTMDGPQGVYFRARVNAPPAAIITVDAHDTEVKGCARCICDIPCEITGWTPTAVYRCDESTGQYQEREDSNCGTSRWTDLRAVAWTPTGETRCTATNVEVQEVNDCGDTRWVTGAALTWALTGETRCSATNVEVQEANNCGDLRWVTGAALTWTPTGETRCTATNVEVQEVNDCGALRWTVGVALNWVATGETRCNGTNVERQEVNDCGGLRWVIDTAIVWTETGVQRCTATNVERQEVNHCGGLRWVTGPAVQWVETGEQRCNATHVQRQEVNDCGATRWVDGEANTVEPTGETRCQGDDQYTVMTDRCGRLSSVLAAANTRARTGVTRCNYDLHLVEEQTTNACGVLQWATTTEVCGYCADFPLPGGGFGFTDPAAMPGAAALLMEGCDGEGPSVYLLAAPMLDGVGRPYATKAVYDAEGVVVGYAMNASDCAPELGYIEDCQDCGVAPQPFTGRAWLLPAGADVDTIPVPQGTVVESHVLNNADPFVAHNFSLTVEVSAPIPAGTWVVVAAGIQDVGAHTVNVDPGFEMNYATVPPSPVGYDTHIEGASYADTPLLPAPPGATVYKAVAIQTAVALPAGRTTIPMPVYGTTGNTTPRLDVKVFLSSQADGSNPLLESNTVGFNSQV